ncbi:MAG: hypothetical protein AAF598_09035 [Bacteroidota bacterium]
MKTPQYCLVLLLVVLSACRPSSTEPEIVNPEDEPIDIKLEDRCPDGYASRNCIVTPPVDSAAIIEALNIQDSKRVPIGIWEEDLDHLEEELDTIVLFYAAYACDCPQWIDVNWKANRVDPMVQKVYDTFTLRHDSAHMANYYEPYYDGFYLERVRWKYKIPSELMVPGNKFRFIGRRYNKLSHPWHYEPMGNTDYPSARVFRYYSFEAVKPYPIWGPQVYEDCSRSMSGEVQCPTLQLTVREE